ncbi:hypothetical protein J4573_36170 [Actinomadura barringtoniae]|uniref:Uncharacterized protein n=1 Tax=Actinomadura barringtoniae TaxID=1427535 RepID=A0A939TDR8_9ACTN|nr:hypothetical protein [Actinomadura barringtoniae]MBO2452575.1 hypothetical protein [Actinomadura barringtoniae]
MLIDCDGCQVRGTGCGDCVVTTLLAAPATAPAGEVDIDEEERRALQVLADLDMVPPLRLAHRRGRAS